MDSMVLDDNSARQFLERRLQENDVKGAIDFAKRKQNMFPKLKKLFRFLGNIVVQIFPEDEEIDWYTVLGVDPLADPKTMKQRYVQLAKNNRLKSYEAHKLLNKAWDILSNTCTRKDYDLRRRSREMQQNALAQAKSATENVSQAFSNINNAVINYQPAPVLYNVSSAAHLIQPAPGLSIISGNNGRDLANVTSDTDLIQPAPGLHNVAGNYDVPRLVTSDEQSIQLAPGLYNVSLATPLIQPAPGLSNISGNNGRDLASVTSDTHLIQPEPGLHNVEGNNNVPKLVTSNAQSFQLAPGLYNVSENNGTGLETVPSSKTQLIQTAPGQYNVSGNNVSKPRLVSTDTPSIQPPPGLYNISGSNGRGLATVSSAAQLIQPERVSLKRRSEGDQISETRAKKAPCIDVRKPGFSLPPVAGSVCLTDVKHEKKMTLLEETCDSSKQVPENHMTPASDGQKREYLFTKGIASTEKVGGSVSRKGNSKKKLADVEKNNLMKKATNLILDKLNQWNASAKDNNERNPADNIESAATKGPEEDLLKTMEVPDSDFHDFDKDRTKKSFAEKEVWAIYDDDDGMPRLYAIIRKASKRPFKLQISWLNSTSNMELESVKWIDSGFHKTCGDFLVGKKEINIKLNSFSHKVTGWTKASRVFQIFPRKGDVWALYRNWSPHWSEHTTEDEKHKYDMVEVVEDYHDKKGVIIVPLVKVSGFKAVFRQHSDAKEVRTVPKQEIFRFSHQVSSYLLKEEEAPDVPKGSKELDPAAMPLELLQVIN